MRRLSLAAAAVLSVSVALAPSVRAAAPATKAPAHKATATSASSGVVEPGSVAALQKMSAYLATLSSFEITSQTSRDLVTGIGQRVQIDGVTTYKVRRPDKFVIDVSTSLKKRRFFHDGKTFTVFAPELGYYATAPAPATNAQTLDVLYDKFGIEVPLEDLFRWNDPASRRTQATMTSGFHVGASTVDGVATEHYAFREGDIDWQVWIQTGAQPLPLKVVIVDRSDPASPAFVATLAWRLNPNLPDSDFAFAPGTAKPIRLTAAAP